MNQDLLRKNIVIRTLKQQQAETEAEIDKASKRSQASMAKIRRDGEMRESALVAEMAIMRQNYKIVCAKLNNIGKFNMCNLKENENLKLKITILDNYMFTF